jgi:hypothetical protein
MCKHDASKKKSSASVHWPRISRKYPPETGRTLTFVLSQSTVRGARASYPQLVQWGKFSFKLNVYNYAEVMAGRYVA